MRVGILTLLWQRPDLTRLWMEHYREWGEVIAVGSPEDDTESRDFATVLYRNDPLSEKWNAGAETFGGDALLVVGSDDFVSRNYLDAALELIDSGCDIVYPQSMYYLNALSGECLYTYYARCGTGRVLSKRLLDRVGGRPWMDGRYLYTDGAMDEKIGPVRGRVGFISDVRKRGMCIVDVKTRENLWPYGWALERNHQKVSAEEVYEHFPQLCR